MIARLPVTVTIDVSESTTIGETDVNFNGVILAYAITVPALAGTTTVTLKLEDEDDVEWYSKASIAEGATTVVTLQNTDCNLNLPVFGTTTVQVTASGAQVADQDITVVFLYNDGK
jgi:hypothetical protein